MAITAIFRAAGMTAEQYDQVHNELRAKGADAPGGRLYHIANKTDDGWLVVDVWESEAKLGKFAETLMPILAAAGVTPPEPEIHPVHNIIKGSE